MDATAEHMVIEQLRELRLQMEENAKEARADRKAIEERIEKLMREGCAKANMYGTISLNQSEIFSRLGVVERAQAEGKGKLAAACAVLGAFVAFGLQWLGKHL